MTRGFLWTDLRTEVEDEFRYLATSPHVPGKLTVFIDQHAAEWLHRETQHEDEVAQPYLRETREQAWVQRRQSRAPNGGRKAIKTGLCKRCDKQRLATSTLCQYHRELYVNAKAQFAQRKTTMLQRGEREKLPVDRQGVTWHFTIHTRDNEEVKGYVTANTYPDGRLAEVFVKMGKVGDTSAWIDEWAKDFSLLLQVGYPLVKLCKMHMHTQFDPMGATGCTDRDLARCSSVVDLVCKWALKNYGSKAVAAASTEEEGAA